MVGSGSTASANNASTGRDELPRIAGHVLRRAEVDVSTFDRARDACIRLGGQRQGTDGMNALDGVQHGHRTHATVAADDVGAPFFQPRAKTLCVGTAPTNYPLTNPTLAHRAN